MTTTSSAQSYGAVGNSASSSTTRRSYIAQRAALTVRRRSKWSITDSNYARNSAENAATRSTGTGDAKSVNRLHLSTTHRSAKTQFHQISTVVYERVPFDQCGQKKTGTANDRGARPCPSVFIACGQEPGARESLAINQFRTDDFSGRLPPNTGSRREVGIRSRLACRSACERGAGARRSIPEWPLREWRHRGR